MVERVHDIHKLIYIGAFISILSLVGIIINKYSNIYRQGSELNIALYSLCIFALTMPFVLYFKRDLTRIRIISGFLLLMLLYFDLFIWIVIFHGLKAMPSASKSLYFLIPPGMYFLAILICELMTVKNKNPEKL